MTILILHGIGGHAGIHWQGWLSGELVSKGHRVLMPELPDPGHPDRAEWLNVVTDLLAGCHSSDTLIVAHSLGVATALDYLEKSQAPIAGFVSVAGFAYDYGSDLNGYFMRSRTIDLKRVREHAGSAAVIYGDNDPYVSQKALAQLALGLGVRPLVIKGGGHLNSDAGFAEFPQLRDIVLSMAHK